ncbi:MAG: helix-turn-helix transcriptional regulator [Acidimicrobiia bacterium]|nr:helix-turn-helix transcriptional regulator [Acidimicrobiia bacterium]
MPEPATDPQILEGHPFDDLVDDDAQAERIRDRASELLREDAALKGVRLAAGIPQKDVAADLSVSPSAVSQLEARDLAEIQLGTLTRYFEALGYDLELTLTPKP